MLYHYIIETFFGFAIFINALLFVPQIIAVVKQRSAKDVSLITFAGFVLIQLATVCHAVYRKDVLLGAGTGLSLILCSSLVCLIIVFRKKQSQASKNIDKDTLVEGLSLKQLVAQFPGHLYWKDLEGRCLGASDKQCHELGFANIDEMLGKSEFDFYPLDQAKKIVANDREILAAGDIVTVEEEANTAAGDVARYMSTKAPLKDGWGNVVGIIGMSVDVTHARTQEITRKELLERIISLLPGNIYWKDRDCRLLGCNLSQAKQIGLGEPKDIVGKKTVDLISKEQPADIREKLADAIDEADRQVMLTGKEVSLEEMRVAQDGTEEVYLSQKVPLYDSDDKQIVGVLGVSVDISDQKNSIKRSEEAKEAALSVNKLRQEILYNLRHDIRTPFSGIIGIAQILKVRLDEEHYPMLDSIESSADQLLSYLNDILEFSQIEAGSIPILCKPFDLKKLCEDCMLMLTPAIKNKSLDMKFDYDIKLPESLISDAFRVKRILVNLLSNAAKFTQSGSVELKVTAVKRIDTAILVRLEVKDTGIGIPEEKYQVIFEKFSRLSSSYLGAHKGIGLGLQAVKNLLEDLEGEVQVESQIGKGSVFTCLIPMQLRIEDRFQNWGA